MALRTARETIYLFSVEPFINKLKEQKILKKIKKKKKMKLN